MAGKEIEELPSRISRRLQGFELVSIKRQNGGKSFFRLKNREAIEGKREQVIDFSDSDSSCEAMTEHPADLSNSDSSPVPDSLHSDSLPSSSLSRSGADNVKNTDVVISTDSAKNDTDARESHPNNASNTTEASRLVETSVVMREAGAVSDGGNDLEMNLTSTKRREVSNFAFPEEQDTGTEVSPVKTHRIMKAVQIAKVFSRTRKKFTAPLTPPENGGQTSHTHENIEAIKTSGHVFIDLCCSDSDSDSGKRKRKHNEEVLISPSDATDHFSVSEDDEDCAIIVLEGDADLATDSANKDADTTDFTVPTKIHEIADLANEKGNPCVEEKGDAMRAPFKVNLISGVADLAHLMGTSDVMDGQLGIPRIATEALQAIAEDIPFDNVDSTEVQPDISNMIENAVEVDNAAVVSEERHVEDMAHPVAEAEDHSAVDVVVGGMKTRASSKGIVHVTKRAQKVKRAKKVANVGPSRKVPVGQWQTSANLQRYVCADEKVLSSLEFYCTKLGRKGWKCYRPKQPGSCFCCYHQNDS